ncbi:MAG TPA: hypothetical protein VFX06_02520 [Stellaceae bacterium]|nr:hypothetical protein [Stellaceae bacterium]
MTEAMSRNERLERWATLLEHSETAHLTPFRDVEFMTEAARGSLQVAHSPLEVASSDPVLRRAGLESDRFGDGSAFFGLSRYQAHRILCSCGYFGRMRAVEVARRVRGLARRERLLRWRPSNPLPALARLVTASWRPLAGQRG